MKIKLAKFKLWLNSDEVYGILCILACCFFYAFVNCFSKIVAKNMHPFTMVFYRNIIALIFILPFVINKLPILLTKSSFNKLNLARGVGGYLSMFLWFAAIKELPVTEVTALSFLTPIFVSILAVVIFKERITFVKVFALIIGFAGTYVILNPKIQGFSIGVFYVLMSCLVWASTNIMVKRLTVTQDAYTIVFYMTLVIVPISLPWLIINPYLPSMYELSYLAVIAIASNIAQVFMAKAYSRAQVTLLMPFDFTRLIFTSLIAFIMFEELLAQNTVMGSLMILLAGYLVAVGEKMYKKREKLKV